MISQHDPRNKPRNCNKFSSILALVTDAPFVEHKEYADTSGLKKSVRSIIQDDTHGQLNKSIEVTVNLLTLKMAFKSSANDLKL